MNAKDPQQAIQDLVLDTLHRNQEAIVEMVRVWQPQQAETGFSWPADPTTAQNYAQATEAGFDFAEKLMASQRKFAEELLKAATPTTEK